MGSLASASRELPTSPIRRSKALFSKRWRMAATLLPEIDTDTCTGCGDCVVVCPTGALALAEGKAVMAHPALCIYDGECEPVCKVAAIQLPYAIMLC